MTGVGHNWSAAVDSGVELAVLCLPYFVDDAAYRTQLIDRVESLWRVAAERSSILPPRFGLLLWLLISGEWAEAKELAAPFARGDLVHSYTALQVLGLIAHYQGDPDVAWACVHEAIPDGPSAAVLSTPNRQTLPLQRVAAELALDEGDRDRADEWLNAYERWLGPADRPHSRVLGRSEGRLLRARYHREGGEHEAARACAVEALELAAQPRQPLALLAAHRFIGELDTANRRFSDAHEQLQAALELAERCSAPYERALTLLALAEMQLAAGQQPTALLDEARAILTRLGATPALARADALAMRLASPIPATYPAGLTPREVEVLRLLAAGRSNREIAAELFMSVRTAERHISNLYSKVDAHSRSEAIAFAHREGLVGE